MAIEHVVGEVISEELLKFAPIQVKGDPIGDFGVLRILYARDGD
jgi:hypothetical protein